MVRAILLPLAMALIGDGCRAFAPRSPAHLPIRQSKIDLPQQSTLHNLQKISHRHQKRSQIICTPDSSPTLLLNGIIMDVPDDFFTYAFFSIGLIYSLGKAYNRYLLEEVAFEQRRMEARERRLDADPTLSEFDLRREESAEWKSMWGKQARGEGKGYEGEMFGGGERGTSRVSVLDDRDDDDDDEYAMSDEEVASFESRYGVEYDPYYDEPYEESELPAGKYKEDKSYGDRRYENGEVFYKDEESGSFYRQGGRPRQKKFWDLNSS